jgi:putative acetyltransferase
MLQYITYQDAYQAQVIDLILTIQQKEFQVPITAEEQPDLKIIPTFYQQGGGNFWLALYDDKVVGTIALIDAGDGVGALRKMFIHKDFRSKYGIAQQLLDNLLDYAINHDIHTICLGTIERLVAARRFYARNGFELILKENLPPQFPIMAVDTLFYQWKRMLSISE